MLSKTTFSTWLSEKPGNEIVGRPKDALSCPLGTFIKETKKVKQVNVTSEILFSFSTTWKEEKLPEWAMIFIDKIDARTEKEVTAKICLDIISKIKK